MPRGKRRSTSSFTFTPVSGGQRRAPSRAEIKRFAFILVVLGGLWFLWLLSRLLSSPQGINFIETLVAASAIAVVVIAAAVFGIRLLLRVKAAGQLHGVIDRAVTEHITALVRRHAQLVTVDAYGTPQIERWHNELKHFLETQVGPYLGKRPRTIMRKRERALIGSISRRIGEEMKERPAFSSLPANATGAEFEAYCADRLRAAGWNAHVTKGARDQGVDVIATKNGVRVVLQCKLHSRPIGNKAVQEAIAGKNFERANYAAVVAVTAYTRDAQQLAETSGVLLLHHSQLEYLDSMLAAWPSGAADLLT